MSVNFDDPLPQPIPNLHPTVSRRQRLTQFYYDLQSLDSHNYGSWPLVIRAFILLIVMLITAGVGYWLPINSQLRQLQASQNQQQVLLETYRTNRDKLKQLQSNLTQHSEQQQLNRLTLLLPSKDQFSLAQQLDELAISSGVMIQDLQLKPELTQSFYTEQPVRLSALGTYQQLGQFLDSLSALPRLITLHDLEVTVLTPKTLQQADSPRLVLTLNVKAYQALTAEQLASSGSNSKLKD